MKNGLIIDEAGNKLYYLNNLLHREDGPAQEWVNGEKFWYLHGKAHREDGPAAKWVDGTKIWYVDGKKHRVDGPAMEWSDGTKIWYLNGMQHRVDGPAQELGKWGEQWYLNDKHLTHPKEFENMEAFIEKLNNNEEYSLQWINDINGIVGFIKKPTGKQSRLHAMRWKI